MNRLTDQPRNRLTEKPNGRKVVNRLFGYSVNWCEAGFTFIEVILVVGILSLIAAVTTPLFARFLAKNHIETTTTTVVGFLRKAQENAMDGKNDATWGVCITGSTLRFYSNTCAAPNVKNDFTIPSPVTITGLTDTTFSKGRGEPSAPVPVSITISSDFGSKTITLNAAGGIEVN